VIWKSGNPGNTRNIVAGELGFACDFCFWGNSLAQISRIDAEIMMAREGAKTGKINCSLRCKNAKGNMLALNSRSCSFA
jgi:hypothetical protein